MDTWVWGFYHTPGVTMPGSVVPGTIPFAYETWTNVNGASLHNLIDLGDDMPTSLQKTIAQALNDVYFPKRHPNVGGTIPFLKEEHVNRAYQMLVVGLEIMTSKERFLARPQPPSVFNDDAPPTFPVPGGGSGSGSGGSSGGSFSLAALLWAILDYIKDLFEYLTDLALWLVSQVTFPLTYPIRYALYLMQLGLYEIYRQFRWALSLSGFAFPDPDQLFNPLAQQFINPATDVQSMPRREFPIEQDHCLFFPAGCPIPQSPGCVEPVAATSGPYTRCASQLSVLVHRGGAVRSGCRAGTRRRGVSGKNHRAHAKSVSAKDRRAVLRKPRQRRRLPASSRRGDRVGRGRCRQPEAAKLEPRRRSRLWIQVLGSHRRLRDDAADRDQARAAAVSRRRDHLRRAGRIAARTSTWLLHSSSSRRSPKRSSA